MAEVFSQDCTQQSTQQSTQHALDPRRLGRSTSGLRDTDPGDIICILHPTSKRALEIVEATAFSEPRYILQNGMPHYNESLRRSPSDLALRFSSPVKNRVSGFVFGRHEVKCDIILETKASLAKRVSNTHFRIFLNNAGVLMVEDTSTNGTIVDDTTIGCKRQPGNPKTRMLSNSSVIQILAPVNEDIIKFVVRIPSREGFWTDYRRNFKVWMEALQDTQLDDPNDADEFNHAKKAVRAIQGGPLHGTSTQRKIPVAEPLAASDYGMKWDGDGRYRCTGHLGKGAFALVYQVATTDTGQVFAAKEIEKRRVMKQGRLDTKIDNEMRIMKGLRHPNIVEYIDYHETDNHLYIIMEFIPFGDVAGYMQKHNRLPEHLARDMSRQIFDALGYLHQKNITHRDIKPDNILISCEDPFLVKLTDFGLSKVVTNNETFLKTFCGTLLYCAPEVFPHYDKYMAGRARPKRGRKDTGARRSYSQLVDIWSYAAVLWYVLCARTPFEGTMEGNGQVMFERIMETPPNTQPLRDHNISEAAIDLLLQMLNTDPLTRPSEAELLRHPWLYDGSEPYTKFLPIQLDAIDEQEENSDELDASQLRIHDDPDGNLDQFDDSPEDANDRDTKRLRNESPTRATNTSPRLLRQTPLKANTANGDKMNHSNADPSRPKLFGEISASLGEAFIADASVGQDVQYSQVSRASSDALHKSADPSLYGAEAMVRDLHMASSYSSGAVNKRSEQELNANSVPSSAAHSYDGDVRDQRASQLPKPKPFSRQIDLPLPASFFFDPYDPGTHNLEYATRVSGIDFLRGEKLSKSAWEASPAGQASSSFKENQAKQGVQELKSPRFKVPGKQLGRLVSTPDSFVSVSVDLTTRISTWGRTPTNTHVYSDPQDTRVPKVAFEIWFASRSLPGTYGSTPGSAAELPTDISLSTLNSQYTVQDLAAQNDLEAMIRTQSNAGIAINGIKLSHIDHHGRRCYGHLHHGDKILAANGNDGSKLIFDVELFYGQTARPREREFVAVPGR